MTQNWYVQKVNSNMAVYAFFPMGGYQHVKARIQIFLKYIDID